MSLASLLSILVPSGLTSLLYAIAIMAVKTAFFVLLA